jgi:hypothetical protein
MKSSRITERVLDFSMSVDGGVISPSGFDPMIALEAVREVFVRIHPVIVGATAGKGGGASSHGFLSKDRRFVLKSIKDEEGGVARLHYIRSRKKQGQKP